MQQMLGKSDNLVQLSGFLTKDVITNEKKSFAAFTNGKTTYTIQLVVEKIRETDEN